MKIDTGTLNQAMRRLQGRKGYLLEGTLNLDELLLPNSLSSQLATIAMRMANFD